MIQQFMVKDFKGHEGYNSFDLPGLTLVSGTNNSGKSSLLQALFLLTQNKRGSFTTLGLNDQLKLGTFSEVLNKETDREDTIELVFYFDSVLLRRDRFEELRVQLKYQTNSLFDIRSSHFSNADSAVLSGMSFYYCKDSEANRVMDFELHVVEGESLYQVSGDTDQGYVKLSGVIPEPIVYRNKEMTERDLCSNDLDIIRKYLGMLSQENIRYLKAFRLDDYKDVNESRSHELGLSGEYTAEVIATRMNESVDFENEGRKMRFVDLFDLWVHRLLGEEYRVRAELDNGHYRILVQEPKRKLQFHLNQVGFGISQLLPILTMVLMSKKGDLILIENPEVHLHPKLQALFMDLCLFAVEHGRKVVIETHSEHLINRTRLKIKQQPDWLDKIQIYFFEKIEGAIRQTEIVVTPEGKLEHWPKNFFDQTYHDLLGLIE